MLEFDTANPADIRWKKPAPIILESSYGLRRQKLKENPSDAIS